ncbi:MAG: hypothetical protein ACPGYX_04925 [Oceanobacter sp.]
MKFLIYLVLACGVGVLMLPMLEKHEQFQSVSKEVTEQVRSTVSNMTGSTNKSEKYFRWQDSDGNWQFGDRSSVPTGVAATELDLSDLTNILKSVDTSEFMERMDSPSNSVASEEFDLAETPDSLSLLLNPQQALKTIEEAKKVKAMMEARNRDIEERFAQ